MADHNNIILEARNIRTENRGAVTLDVQSLKVCNDEVLSIIGPNGAGKTTLLQRLAMLQRKPRGELLFRGKRVGTDLSATEYRRCVTMVFQETLLFDTTVFENVASGLRFRHTGKDEIERVVSENLELFGVAHLTGRSVRTLSGGEARRVSLARSFAVRPDIIFLDEPFSALDPPTHESIVADLSHILRRPGMTTVFATHDRSEALRLSDRICVMDRGKILQIGTPDEIMNHPADDFIASFVGAETILPGIVTDGNAGTISVNVGGRDVMAVGEAKAGQNVVLCIRPERIALSVESRLDATSERNVLAGTVVDVTSLGLYYRVTVDCGFILSAYITPGSVKKLGIERGKNIHASFKATAVHVLKR
ncbi:MAG: tungsten transporter binding protein [Deltaproteobacteria bacterium]|nr:tungsten transporter binding protein [Deltaproteobacteria bacterium]